MTDDETQNVMHRYDAKFGELPPLLYWQGEPAEIERMMERAIEEGKPLTAQDLWDAQGMEPPPKGAFI
jgi:hypothetical protein